MTSEGIDPTRFNRTNGFDSSDKFADITNPEEIHRPPEFSAPCPFEDEEFLLYLEDLADGMSLADAGP